MEWFRISTSTELVRVGAIHAENGMGTAGNIHVGQTFHLNLYQRAGRTGTIFWESSSKAKHKNGNKKDAFAHDFYHNISLITLFRDSPVSSLRCQRRKGGWDA